MSLLNLSVIIIGGAGIIAGLLALWARLTHRL